MKAFYISLALIGPGATAAMVATTAFSGALRILRAVLVTLGIPALIIGFAWIIERLLTLKQATGSWGAALGLLGDIAKAVWQGMVDSLEKARLNMSAKISDMVADFLGAFEKIGRAWDSLVNGMASFWNESVAGTMGLGTIGGSFLGDMLADASASARTRASETRAAADAIGDAFGNAKTKLKELRDLLKQEPITFDGAVTGDGAGGGGGGKSASEKVKEEADKIKKTFEDMQKGISQTLSSSFKALLQGTKSFKDAMVDVMNTILDKVFQLIMTPIFDGLAGTIAGGVMRIPGLARGTNNARGGLARINERGGEMAVLPGGTQVIPADLSRRMVDNINGGGSGGPMVEVNVVNQSSGTEVKQNRRKGPDGKETVDVIISESIAMGRQDAALNQRLGATPRTVRR